MCPIPLHFQQTFTLLPVAALKTYTEGGPSSLKSTSNARLSSMDVLSHPLAWTYMDFSECVHTSFTHVHKAYTCLT